MNYLHEYRNLWIIKSGGGAVIQCYKDSTGGLGTALGLVEDAPASQC